MSYRCRITCLNPDSKRPQLVFIPGGPGLSSKSLSGVEAFKARFRVYVVDPAGTNGTQTLDTPTFVGHLNDLEFGINSAIEGGFSLVGHSFGGAVAFALKLRLGGSVEVAIGISSPLTSATLKDAGKQYAVHMTSELKVSEAAFAANSSNVTFANWLASYGLLYFSARNAVIGSELLRNDPCDASTFSALNGLIHPDESSFLSAISERSREFKLIAAPNDLLVRPECLRAEAASLGIDCFEVPDAGHFALFDNATGSLAAVEQALKSALKE